MRGMVRAEETNDEIRAVVADIAIAADFVGRRFPDVSRRERFDSPVVVVRRDFLGGAYVDGAANGIDAARLPAAGV
jgi:hypothetical protein